MERKIIHIDMDCFYAAIEVRDNPSLRDEPVAVGGRSSRGVLTTCNYKARRFGVHSAMPNFMALRRCPHLVILPVRFEAYRQESRHICKIKVWSPKKSTSQSFKFSDFLSRLRNFNEDLWKNSAMSFYSL